MSSVHSREQAQAITLRQPGHSQHRLIHTSARLQNWDVNGHISVCVEMLDRIPEHSSSSAMLGIMRPPNTLHITAYAAVACHKLLQCLFAYHTELFGTASLSAQISSPFLTMLRRASTPALHPNVRHGHTPRYLEMTSIRSMPCCSGERRYRHPQVGCCCSAMHIHQVTSGLLNQLLRVLS